MLCIKIGQSKLLLGLLRLCNSRRAFVWIAWCYVLGLLTYTVEKQKGSGLCSVLIFDSHQDLKTARGFETIKSTIKQLQYEWFANLPSHFHSILLQWDSSWWHSPHPVDRDPCWLQLVQNPLWLLTHIVHCNECRQEKTRKYFPARLPHNTFQTWFLFATSAPH